MDRELRAVLFDFDGTIAETERDGHRIAYNRAFAEQSLDWVWDEALYGELLAIAGGKERLDYYLRAYKPEIAARPDAAELISELHRAKALRFGEVAARIPFRPGVQRLIAEAHSAGVRIAIATTASAAGVLALFAQDAALLAMIDLIAAGDVVERKKPAPDIYRWALERLDLSPAECIAIEDSAIGLRAALEAGIATVVTPSDYTANEQFSGAVSVVSHLGEPGRPALPVSGMQPEAGIVDVTFLRRVIAVSKVRLQSWAHEKSPQ